MTVRRKTTDGEAGFTLLETLIALLILALAIGTAVQSVAMASSQIVMAGQARQVEAVAKRILSLQTEPPEADDLRGEDKDSGYEWAMSWRQFPTIPDADAERYTGYLVTLSVATGGMRGRTYRFRRIVMVGQET
jgi:prepilin-type N-terminal cleavage/methylation domain-containing protein